MSRSSSITYLEQFNENEYVFRIFGQNIHCRVITFFTGLFGFLCICVVFVLAFYGRWNISLRYEDPVDLLAILAFLFFITSGTFVHVSIMMAVKKNDGNLLNPSVIFHSILIFIEIVMIFTSISELVSDKVPHFDANKILARQILYIAPSLIMFNSTTLYFVLTYRRYLFLRQNATFQGTISPVFFGHHRIGVDSVVEVKTDI